jgi:hypothetical protein
MAGELIRTANIAQRIHIVRGQRVMLDRDLAALYRVETRALNQAVSRNRNRFPKDFMFELTRPEILRISQIVTSSDSSRSQSVILKRGQNIKCAPLAFTEAGGPARRADRRNYRGHSATAHCSDGATQARDWIPCPRKGRSLPRETPLRKSGAPPCSRGC